VGGFQKTAIEESTTGLIGAEELSKEYSEIFDGVIFIG
jgi:hypothetical protein